MAEVKLKFTADTASATRGIDRIKASLTKLKSIGSNFGNVLQKGLLGMAVGLTAVGAAALKGTKDIIDFAGEIKDISDSTGISIKSLITLREQFRQAGVDAGRLQFVLSTLSNKLQDPDETTIGWLDKWKLSLEELQGMGVEERFETIKNKIGEMATQAERLKASKDFFGKAGADLVRLFSDAESKINAEKMLGDLPNTMTVIAGTLEAAGDKFDGLAIKWNQFFSGFASQLLGPITEAAGLVESLDLTQLGVRAGMIVGGLIDAFKNGTLLDVIAEATIGGFKIAIVEIGAILTYVIGRAAFAGLQWAVNNVPALKAISAAGSLTGSNNQYQLGAPRMPTGKDLAMGWMNPALFSSSLFIKKNENYNADADMPALTEWRGMFNDIFAEFKDSAKSNMKGITDVMRFKFPEMITHTAAEWKQAVSESLESIKASKIGEDFTKNFFQNAMGKEDMINWANNFLGIPLDFKSKEQKEGAFTDMEPIVSSLGRIGGAAGETNSVSNFHKSSLEYQKQIAYNTAKMTGGAIIG